MSSVWLTGQRTARAQRRGRYLPESMAHPGKMLPAIATHAIKTFTRPGELVVDPMCGIGTSLVEAMHLDRHAAGVEYETRWTEIARANCAHAIRQGATGRGTVVGGDARAITTLLDELRGRVALVLTSPPYGNSLHGHIAATRESGHAGIRKWNHRYSLDPGNLAHQALPELLDGFTQILHGCRQLLKPRGMVAVTARPFRVHGDLVDLPGQVIAAGQDAGLSLVDRIACLICAIRDDRIVSRNSFFQLRNARDAQQRGLPWHAVAHEDLLIFQSEGDGRVA